MIVFSFCSLKVTFRRKKRLRNLNRFLPVSISWSRLLAMLVALLHWSMLSPTTWTGNFLLHISRHWIVQLLKMCVLQNWRVYWAFEELFGRHQRSFWLQMREQWSWKLTSVYHLLMKRVLKEAKLRPQAETRKLTCISSLWSKKMEDFTNWVSLWLFNSFYQFGNLFFYFPTSNVHTTIQIVFLMFNCFDCP